MPPFGEQPRLTPLGWYARALALATVALLYLGALVTTTGSGLAVPDWPLSFGTLFPQMVGGVLFEHGHRLAASLVGGLTVIMALWATLASHSSSLRRVAWLALALVICQGLLGGLTVLLRLPTIVSVAHGCLAQIFLCTTIALVMLTTPSFKDPRQTLEPRQAWPLRSAAVTALIVGFCQLLIGATMRHMGAGLVIPDFPTSMGGLVPPLVSLPVVVNFTHRVMALVVMLAQALLVSRCLRSRLPLLRRFALALMALVTVQIGLGACTVWSGRGVIFTSLHVVNGALLLATTFATALWVFRLSWPGILLSEGPVAAPLSRQIRAWGQVSRRDWMELFKVRLVTMAAFTAACSYWIGAYPSPDWKVLAEVVVGICLLGAGSGALNHVLEVETDGLMNRTRNRPLPSGRLGMASAELVGGALGLGGILFLGVAISPLCGLLAALTL